MKASLIVLATSLFASFAAAAVAQNRTFTSQYSFGDSLSDNGNLFALGRIPPAPYFNGRFSNGPVFTELLGNPLVPAATVSTQRGNLNFAVGGASVVLPGAVPTLPQQIALYRLQGLPASPTDLFTVLAGANDLLSVLPAGAANPAQLDFVSTGLATVVAQNVQSLITLGAKNIVVGGMPNLGATPRALALGGPGGAAAALGLRATNAYNAELQTRLQALASGATDVNLLYVDLQGFLDFLAQQHQALGFANATSFYLAPAAQGGGVGDPNSYVFWDDIHPTARTHALLAAVITEQLNPETVVGFSAVPANAALALQGAEHAAIDARVSQVAVSKRARGRADAYASYNYVDGARGREGWRPKFNFEAHVVTAGVDYLLGDDVIVGGAVSGGRMDAEVSGRRGEFEVEDGTGRLYGVWRGGPVSLILDGAYGVVRVKDLRRTTAFGGLPTRAKTSGEVWGAGGKVLWAVDVGAINVRPWLGLRTTRVQLDAYTERDVPTLNMVFDEQEAESTSGEVGVDAALNWKFAGRTLRLDGRVAWHGEMGSQTRTVSGRLANNVTRPTLLEIEDGDGDGVEVGGAATVFFAKNWSASVGYAADIRTSDRVAHRGTISVQTGF